VGGVTVVVVTRNLAESLWGLEPEAWPAWTCTCGQRHSGWSLDCGRCGNDRVENVRDEAARKRGRASKNKGNRAELEVQKIAQAHGFDGCRRNFGSGSRGGGDLIGIPGVSIECKRVEKLNVHAAFEQASRAAQPTETPVVAFRRSHGPWLAVLELSELMALLKLRDL
jgi:hypothetical protein